MGGGEWSAARSSRVRGRAGTPGRNRRGTIGRRREVNGTPPAASLLAPAFYGDGDAIELIKPVSVRPADSPSRCHETVGALRRPSTLSRSRALATATAATAVAATATAAVATVATTAAAAAAVTP